METFNCGECQVEITRARKGKGFCQPCALRRNMRRAQKFSNGRGPARQGETRSCVVCHKAFYVTQSDARRGAKFCSQKCMGKAGRVARTCEVCGGTFHNSDNRTKTCGKRPCVVEIKARSKRGKRYLWEASREICCRICGSSHRLNIHHVVYEQHVRREGGNTLDPDNGLTLCFTCHMKHHHGADDRIAVSQLREENVDFAFDLLGPAAYDYFIRYYDNDRKEELATRAGIVSA
jgi:hypothetical protein